MILLNIYQYAYYIISYEYFGYGFAFCGSKRQSTPSILLQSYLFSSYWAELIYIVTRESHLVRHFCCVAGPKFRLSAFLKISGSAQALDIVSFGCASIAQHEKFESKMAALGLVVNWIRAPCWMGCTCASAASSAATSCLISIYIQLEEKTTCTVF